MQELLDAHENWHNYEVHSRPEVVALLRSIGDKKQLVSMRIPGQADMFATSVVATEPDSGFLYLDIGQSSEQNRRIVAAGRLAFETSLDKIRILFGADQGLQESTWDGRPAFRMPIPSSLIRLQRREYYRMPTPVSNPLRAMIPLPPPLGGGSAVFHLADISCGGIAILDHTLLLKNTIGDVYKNCRIELPEGGTIETSLQIRNTLDLTMLNSKTNRRLGCEFSDISRGNMANVQRYITRLERERNARMAGMG